MKLDVLTAYLECRAVFANGDMVETEITDVTDRGEECMAGGLFVCIEGQRKDGHAFASVAVKNGAAAVVCVEGRGDEIRRVTAPFGDPCVIEVRDTRSAYAKLCGVFYGVYDSDVKIVCVTGTNGKTSVSSMIRDALCACGRRAALLGTLGGEFEGRKYGSGTMTTPDPKRLYGILSEFISSGAEYVIMEASSHALALRKLDGLRVYLGIFTNLTPEHLDFHGNMEEYAGAKALLFEKCELGGVFFADDPYCENMMRALPEGRKSVRCSASCADADYRVEGVPEMSENGVRFTVISGNYRAEGMYEQDEIEVFCRSAGVFSLYNSLLAFASLRLLGLSPKLAAEGIAAFRGVRGRMEKVETPPHCGVTVFIDFAHTPDALSKLIRTVRDICGAERRIVVLFGCGGDRDRSKRALMGAISSRLADLTVITSDNSRSESVENIINDILTGVDKAMPYTVIPERRRAIEYVLESSAAGDVILLCGKGHEEYEIIGTEMRPFSERKIVLEFFEGWERRNGG